MKHGTAIEWTHLPGYKGETWNPWVGCSKVSPGCEHCYALRRANRLKSYIPHYRNTAENGNWTGQVNIASDEQFYKPLRLRAPRAIFPCSMSDFFHEGADEWRDTAWHTMYNTPQHLYLILTKRPERILDCLPYSGEEARKWPLPNVYLGTSVEDADHLWRVEKLVETPAAKRFLSLEPLLGEVDLSPWLPLKDSGGRCTVCGMPHGGKEVHACHPVPRRKIVDWVIVGGESGPRARPMHPDWVRKIRDQCQAARVLFFFKQWGEYAPEDIDPTASLENMALFPQGESTPIVFKTDLERERWQDWEDPDFRQEGDVYMARVGKKKAGRILDGRTWEEMP